MQVNVHVKVTVNNIIIVWRLMQHMMLTDVQDKINKEEDTIDEASALLMESE